MKFGAIDIGTNAARLLIGEVMQEEGHHYVKKVSYTRVPLRLGEEVFEDGKLSPKKIENFVKTIKAFRLITEIFEVKDLRICATSAMREAENATEVHQKIIDETGVNIEIISGDVEAELIFGSFFMLNIDKLVPFLVVDVGGGSTEISVFEKGERIASKSFQIGTLRMLKGKTDENIWNTISFWIQKYVNLKLVQKIYATGGNINKTHKLLGAKYLNPIHLEDINDLKNQLEPLSLEQRMDKFQLKPDRADVLVPALQIYCYIMNELQCEEIIVPKIGLSDGMIFNMYQNYMEKSNHYL